MSSPPQRPGAQLWSIVAGPLVNVALDSVFTVAGLGQLTLGWQQTHPDACHSSTTLVDQSHFADLQPDAGLSAGWRANSAFAALVSVWPREQSVGRKHRRFYRRRRLDCVRNLGAIHLVRHHVRIHSDELLGRITQALALAKIAKMPAPRRASPVLPARPRRRWANCGAAANAARNLTCSPRSEPALNAALSSASSPAWIAASPRPSAPGPAAMATRPRLTRALKKTPSPPNGAALSNCAPASWSAAALRRFSPAQQDAPVVETVHVGSNFENVFAGPWPENLCLPPNLWVPP